MVSENKIHLDLIIGELNPDIDSEASSHYIMNLTRLFEVSDSATFLSEYFSDDVYYQCVINEF